MESKMEGLVCEIQTVVNDFYSYKQSHQFQASPIRRVRSSTTPTKKSTVMKHSKKDDCITQTSASIDLSEGTDDHSTSSLAESSDSNIITTKFVRERSSSASASSFQTKPPLQGNSSVKLGGRSVSVDGPWNLSTTIPEAPESPCLAPIPDYPFSSSASSTLYSSFHGTAPRSHCRETYSSPTPPSWPPSRHTSMVTSTPNISHGGSDENYCTLPSRVVSTSIPEYQVGCANCNDNLSQLSAYTDEGSPKQGNSFIIRRSSLTGQLEHFRKPRYNIEKMGTTETKSAQCRPQWGTGFRVLNKGIRKSKKRKSTKLDQVILPGVETTV